MESDQRRQVRIDPAGGRLELRSWVDRWFPVQDLDPRTLDNYESYLRCHVLVRFGATPLGEITALDVDAWVKESREAGYAAATVSSQLNLLSMLLTDAADELLIPFNPVHRRRRRGRRSRREVGERIWATPEQVVRIAEQAGALGGPIARLLVITAAWTGCRWGELAGLHRDNVDLRRGLLVIDPLVGALHESGSMRWLGPPKTRASARTIVLPPFLTALLREHLVRHRYEFVFTTPSGTWLWRSTFLRRVFRPAVDGSEASGAKAGCAAVRAGLTFHGLRHSHKTWLIAGGAPEIAQARRLGHHLDNRVIETYSHVAPEVEQRLLDDLERRWYAAAPLPPTPSPSVVDSGRMAAVPLFATVGVTHRESRGAAGIPRRRPNGAGAVLQFCPTRSARPGRKPITEDRTRNAENPSDQPERLKRRGSSRVWS
ncbi:tyrosine-type recombinase/integrase [Amycolatopsis sp. CA-126428]|uniref:tyrosine-type recombinase/integrase n=1 Tax=Amycolatopsis sp. CA-126428 TaxID=2073158 RepID=UPI001E60258C|nr:site-specific integrase [Amycolatopsis sp. CA-126428]